MTQSDTPGSPGASTDWQVAVKKYIYTLIGAEVSTLTRFFDACLQLSPLPHDDGLLLANLECERKQVVPTLANFPAVPATTDQRTAVLYNANFNYLHDIEQELSSLKPKLTRHDRVVAVIFNPFMRAIYRLADRLGLRDAPLPDTFVTYNDLENITRLAGFEVVRLRPTVFIPLPIPLLAPLINKVFAVIPLIRRLSFVWMVVLRPVMAEKNNPSLSIIIPARNEAGNIEAAVQRIPELPGAEVEVIFVEGGSSDETWQRIQEQVARQPRSFTIKAYQQTGRGKYNAVRLGFEMATKELVTILDADLTMPPELLSRFYRAYCQGLGDFINGNRLLYLMEEEAMRPLNRLGNIFFAKTLAWILELKIGDSLCGTKLFPRQDYGRQVKWRERFGDFDPFGDFEMLFAAAELALGVQDVPIRYLARAYGQTQISRFRDGLKLARMVLIAFVRIFLGKTK